MYNLVLFFDDLFDDLSCCLNDIRLCPPEEDLNSFDRNTSRLSTGHCMRIRSEAMINSISRGLMYTVW